MLTIRDASLQDAGRLLQIFEHYIKNTAIAFEYEPPSLDEFTERMRQIMRRYPYLVIEEDGEIKGYACAHAFVGRAAYDWSCELTIYLDPHAQKRGMGRMLYEALEKALCDMGVLNLYACIGYPEREDEYLTANSADFHRHSGFVTVGEFRRCGYKFGRWYHMIWMEKVIGEHKPDQPPVIPYPALKKTCANLDSAICP